MNSTELNKVARRIADKIEDARGYSVEIKEVEKINTLKTALIVNVGADNIHPTVYIPDQVREMDIEEISEEMIADAAKWLLEAIDNAMNDHPQVNITEIEKIMNSKELFLSKVIFVLVNKHWNKKNEAWVSTPVDGDLEYIYYIPVEISGVCGGVKVLNKHIAKLGITNDEIYEAALKNTEIQRPVKITDIHDFIATRLRAAGACFDDEALIPSGIMYIVSNKDGYQGAAAMLYPSTIEGFNDMLGDNYVIIPSSIHECLVVALPNGMEDPAMLNAMVQEVNITSVDPEERLSDHVYKIINGQLKSIML